MEGFLGRQQMSHQNISRSILNDIIALAYVHCCVCSVHIGPISIMTPLICYQLIN